MTIRTLKHWGTALWLILLGASLAGAQLTVKDVISLKKLGFSDAEILAEAAKSGAKMALTEADLAQLKAAGASDALIQALRNPPREITLDEVKRMVQAGQSADRIIEAIAASPNKPAAGAADVLELQRQNVPVAVLFALRGRPLGAVDLRSLAEEHTAPPVFERLGNLLGYIQTDLAAEEALALMRIGVPADSVKGLKTAVAVPPQPKNDPKTEPPLPAPPEPVEELVGTWEGTIKSAGMTANAVLTFINPIDLNNMARFVTVNASTSVLVGAVCSAPACSSWALSRSFSCRMSAKLRTVISTVCSARARSLFRRATSSVGIAEPGATVAAGMAAAGGDWAGRAVSEMRSACRSAFSRFNCSMVACASPSWRLIPFCSSASFCRRAMESALAFWADTRSLRAASSSAASLLPCP